MLVYFILRILHTFWCYGYAVISLTTLCSLGIRGFTHFCNDLAIFF